LTVTRTRPGLVFQREAGPEIRDYFLGALAPRPLLRLLDGKVPLLPWPAGILTQTIHADDLAAAMWQAIARRVGGAFNIAAEPVLGPDVMGFVLGARRWLPVPVGLLRAAVAVSYHLRLQPTDPGWVDMAVVTPVMSTAKARSELDWEPRRSSVETLAELVGAIHGRGGLGNAGHRPHSPAV
ncbi:MAG: epimerase, partial [Brachybacterium sp.]|nr:epimerase [Brachybacterium sp.]